MVANGPFSRRRLINEIGDLRAAVPRIAPFCLGRTLYVSSVYGSDSAGRGTDPTAPLATLTYALSVLAADILTLGIPQSNDLIILAAEHAEAIGAAAAIAFNVTGVTIIGVGNGRKRPKLTWGTDTAATATVTGAQVKFKNIVFDFTGIDAVVAGIKVDAADVSFEDCEFITNSGTAGVVSGITVGATTTSPRFEIRNCVFRGPATNSGTTTTAQVTLTDAPDFRILGCYFTGKCTQNITNGAAILRGEIDNCRFVTYTGTKSINMHASSTPFISNCRFNVPSGTAPIVAAAGFVAGNVYSAGAGVTAGTASTF